MWLTSTPLVSGRLVQIAEGWRDRLPIDAIAHGDAVLVLSGGYSEVPGTSGASEFDDFDRALAGYDLYRAGKAPRIMFTGGWSALRPELETVGAVLRKRALSFGVPDSDIIVVGRASNTEEEARAVREHFAVNPIMDADTGQPRAPRIILVTSAFHMTRAESLSRAAGLDVTPFPVDFRGPTRITLRSFIPSGLALAQTELALHEIYGCVYYWLRGLVVGSSIWCTPHRRRFGHTRSRRSTRVRARHRHRTRHRTPRHHLGERALFLPAVHVGG